MRILILSDAAGVVYDILETLGVKLYTTIRVIVIVKYF